MLFILQVNQRCYNRHAGLAAAAAAPYNLREHGAASETKGERVGYQTLLPALTER